MKYQTFVRRDCAAFETEEEMVLPTANDAFSPQLVSQEMGRPRLHTADTLVMRNTPLDGKVIETSPKPELDDDSSLVSSLSNDDSLIGPSQNEVETELLHLQITVPTPENFSVSSIPSWLKRDGDVVPPPAPMAAKPPIVRRAESAQDPNHHHPAPTLVPSPSIPRPSFGRIMSCPTTAIDFSITGASPSRLQPLASLDESSLLDFSTCDPIRKQNSQLLGSRPRRYVRCKSAISVASSMSLTAPSSITSRSASSISLQNASTSMDTSDDTTSTLSSRKKAGRYVRKEFNYVLNRIGSPIQKIKKRQETDSLDWKRSKGCLT